MKQIDMTRLQCWWIIVISFLFGISDRLISSVNKDYSVDSMLQVILGLVLLTLVCQLCPYDLGD